MPVPEGFVLLAPNRLGPLLTTPILSLRGKLRMLLDLVLPRRDDDSDESLAAFVKRTPGPLPRADRVPASRAEADAVRETVMGRVVAEACGLSA